MLKENNKSLSFGGIQFNTALKLDPLAKELLRGFGGIQFNTALKQRLIPKLEIKRFGGIQFNTALKPRRKFFYIFKVSDFCYLS